MAFTTLGVLILWFGWFGFNAARRSGCERRQLGFFAYVALTTNLAAAAGALGAILASWLVRRKPDLSMLLNGVIAALVAITAACGFVAPWAAVVIGVVAGAIAVVGVLCVERIGIDDPIGAVAVHGLAGVWGTLAPGSSRCRRSPRTSRPGSGGLVYTGSLHQLGVQALGILAVGRVHLPASFGALWAMKRIAGIRVDARSSRRASTSPSTACGATPSSTSRCRAGTAASRTPLRFRRACGTTRPHRRSRRARPIRPCPRDCPWDTS